MNRKYKWSVALVALTLILAACAEGSEDGSTTTAAASEASPRPPRGG